MFKTTTYYLLILLLTILLNPFLADAETPALNPPANTEYLATGTDSPKASIEDVNWISGSWQGEIWGGQFEENWSEPSAGSMMASFKFTENKQVKFYELMTISEHQGSLILRLKHFGHDLKGWEQKNQSMNFKLVRLANKVAYFEGYTYKMISRDEMHVFVVIDTDGKKQETQFVFTRKT
jgi:hypothetical protein